MQIKQEIRELVVFTRVDQIFKNGAQDTHPTPRGGRWWLSLSPPALLLVDAPIF